MISRKAIFSKPLLLVISSILVLLILAIFPFYFYNKKHSIKYSKIIIGNDIRSKYLDVVLTQNDSVIKVDDVSNNGVKIFKSNNGNYELKIFIKHTKIISKKFEITENKPKYIYSFFESASSNYYFLYNSFFSKEIAKRTENKTLSRDELRKTVIEIKQKITVPDIEKLGYDIKKEKIKLYIQDKYFMKD